MSYIRTGWSVLTNQVYVRTQVLTKQVVLYNIIIHTQIKSDIP